MSTSDDLFEQINIAVLDLQRAKLQTYSRPLKTLAKLLQHPDLSAINDQLIAKGDLDKFLSESASTGGSMIGSASLVWPDDKVQEIGLCLQLILRFAADPDEMADFGHRYLDPSSKIMDGVNAVTSQIIIPFARDYKTFVQQNGRPETRLKMPLSEKIFIVHGHDGEAREMVARFISHIGLEPIILHEQANRGRTVIEKVEANSDVGFAIVLLTPDDQGCRMGGELEPRARQNVLLELGYFIGKLSRERVCALKRGDLEIPSDFAGVVWENMDAAGAWKQSLSRELDAVGYDIDWNKVMK
ncbi:MAG: hypothetical protein CMK09_11490 [Ponticaulis sp.]|nr:hypothetical protein [Ponticaulis sp.]